MKDKIVVVTGASRGIGRETAIALAKQGAKVILVVRDETRGKEVQAEIPGSELFVGDLSSMKDVKRVGEEILAKHPVIDVLVNNAGALNSDRHLTVDGYERTFATNHLAYMLMTRILLPALEKAPKARIVSVASDAHKGINMDFDDLMGEKRYQGWRIYGQSKLANILFTVELSKRLAGSHVTANSLHPGVIASNFGHDSGGLVAFGVKLIRPFLKSPEDGAKTTIFLASDPSVEGVTGRYFKDQRQTRPTKQAQDEGAASRLWEVSDRLIDAALR